jgi:hypothetical protein
MERTALSVDQVETCVAPALVDLIFCRFKL